MKFVLFYHSFASCWNHGNAHFLRGITRELLVLGHSVTVYEPVDGWSRTHAIQDGGERALAHAAKLVPGGAIRTYRLDGFDVEEALDGADVAIVHEWTAPQLVAQIGRLRRSSGTFVALFHDTHHRAVSSPDDIARFDLDGYDGVLAFGESLRERYVARGWGRRAFTWHEAADTALFSPRAGEAEADLVWIGNWGDGERSREIEEFLLAPIRQLDLRARFHGVRYPHDVRERLKSAGITFGGWLPNHDVPMEFAKARFTVHVPRQHYVHELPGIPTIRVFEALACAIPLISSPWRDEEQLFPPDCYLIARDREQMTTAMALVMRDRDFAADMARRGLAAIYARHTCSQRARELLKILRGIGAADLRRTKGAKHREAVA